MIFNYIKYSILIKVCLLVSVVASSVHAETVKLNFAILGDSMTWIGGDSCQNDTGWTHYLKKSGIAKEIDIYARSGATWTNTNTTKQDTTFYSELLHDDNVIYNQAVKLKQRFEDGHVKCPDVIVLFAGANDAWFANRRPGIFNIQDSIAANHSSVPSEATSLQKSVALVCDILKETFPEDTLIMMISPIEMSKATPDITEKVSEIIENTAKSRDILTLRADKTIDIRHDIESITPTFTYDGVHTNARGADEIAQAFICNLLTLLKDTNIKN